MASGEGNFPVPKIRREPKVRPAMTSGLFENDMTDNLENYEALSSHQRDAGLNLGGNVSGVRYGGASRMGHQHDEDTDWL